MHLAPLIMGKQYLSRLTWPKKVSYIVYMLLVLRPNTGHAVSIVSNDPLTALSSTLSPFCIFGVSLRGPNPRGAPHTMDDRQDSCGASNNLQMDSRCVLKSNADMSSDSSAL